jgi:Antitoxin VbhA
MDDLKAQSDADKRQAKPVVSPAEIERRTHVRIAIAENWIEGIPASRAALEICDKYIRGEIKAHELVAVYKKGQQLQP